MLSTLVTLSCRQADNRILKKKELAISGLVSNDGNIYSVQDAMNSTGLKGLSVAVFEDYQLRWTQSWGIKEVNSNDSIDVHTAFSTASIAKPLTATLFAILEEKGLIDLKEPVSKYLKRWQMPESEFSRETPVSFEHLLSHTAGTTQHGFTDFYQGDTIPTLVQSVKGELPRYDREIELTFVPGTGWRYSGGGYVIAQMAVEDHLGESLADLANENIFKPLDMFNTTMKQPNEKGFLQNVAKAHDENGSVIRTGLPITPQVAPSGLWSTPTDMAIFMIEIQKALAGMETTVISPDVARRVTDIITPKIMGGWSLGWERRHGYANYEWFSHGGANTGIGGYIYATMEDGKGIAFFGNGPNKVRFPVLDQLRNSIIESHDWYRPLEPEITTDIPNDLRSELLGPYTDLVFGEVLNVIEEEGKLYITPFTGGGANELIYIGDNNFLIDQATSTLQLVRDEVENSTYLTLMRNGIQDSKERRLKKLDSTTYEVIFRVTVPEPDDEVFIAGDQEALGNWDPGTIKLDKVSDYERSTRIKLRMPVQFKFTKGNWATEARVKGQAGWDNLRLESEPAGDVYYEVLEWRNHRSSK